MIDQENMIISNKFRRSEEKSMKRYKIVLAGPAGIGKSRDISEIKNKLQISHIYKPTTNITISTVKINNVLFNL